MDKLILIFGENYFIFFFLLEKFTQTGPYALVLSNMSHLNFQKVHSHKLISIYKRSSFHFTILSFSAINAYGGV